MRSSMSSLLRSCGFRVELFAAASEFLASAIRKETACLFLDVHMPGMTGPELQRALLDQGADIPTVFISAKCEDDVRELVMRRGAIDYLIKPFGAEKILAAIAVAAGQEARR
jgi:FixJ family two-component response regulator